VSILGIGWPCMTRGCDQLGKHTVSITYGPEDDAETVGMRFCLSHLEKFVAWFGESGASYSAIVERVEGPAA